MAVTAIVISEDGVFEEPLLRFNATLEPEFAIALNVLKQLVL